jgi:hypothetical protein
VGITVTDTVALLPLVICPKSQRTTWSAAQVPWLALAETRIGATENVPIKLTCDTVFGPMLFTVKFIEVFAPVAEDAGADEETEISAGVVVKLRTTQLRNM